MQTMMEYRLIHRLKMQHCTGSISSAVSQCGCPQTTLTGARLHRSEEHIRKYFKDQRKSGNVGASHERLSAADIKSNTRFSPPGDLDLQSWIPGLERSQTRNSSPKYALLPCKLTTLSKMLGITPATLTHAFSPAKPVTAVAWLSNTACRT